MANSRFRKRRHAGLLQVISLLIVLCLIGCVILAYSQAEPTEYYRITSAENKDVLFFGQGGNQVYLILREEETVTAYGLDLEIGQIVEANLAKEPKGVFVRGDMLAVFNSDDFMSDLIFWRPDMEFEETKLDILQYFFAVPPDGAYTVLADGLLYIAPPGSKLEAYLPEAFGSDPTGFGPVDFLTGTPEGRVYAYTNGGEDETGTLYRWEGSDIDSRVSWPCEAPPTKFLGENAFVNSNDEIFLLYDGEFRAAPEILQQLDPSLCCAGENELYAADPAGTITRYLFTGEITGSFSVSSEICGLTSQGVFVQHDGDFGFMPYHFMDIENDPTPEPTIEPDPSEEPSSEPTEEPTPGPSADSTEEPTPTPESSPEPEPTGDPTPEPEESPTPEPVPGPGPTQSPIYSTRDVDGTTYFCLNARITAKELRELMLPDAVLFLDEEGEPFSEGRLKTGMKMNDMVIVIMGDCNGDGFINASDIKLAEECIIGTSYIRTEAAFQAVDFNGDGALTLSDLITHATAVNENR